jgi:hypothetical protein
MWIVKIALDPPYTFIVLALLILSSVVILNTPTDIFPNIEISVVRCKRGTTVGDAKPLSEG